MKLMLYTALAGTSLILCVVAPVLHFQGKLGEDGYEWLFSIGSIGWFAGATLWTAARRKG